MLHCWRMSERYGNFPNKLRIPDNMMQGPQSGAAFDVALRGRG